MEDKTILTIIGMTLLLIIFIAINQLRNNIKRTNIIIDKIAKKVGVPEPSEDEMIKTFIAQGKKIKAIKRYREITGAGLKEANDYVNKLL